MTPYRPDPKIWGSRWRFNLRRLAPLIGCFVTGTLTHVYDQRQLVMAERETDEARHQADACDAEFAKHLSGGEIQLGHEQPGAGRVCYAGPVTYDGLSISDDPDGGVVLHGCCDFAPGRVGKTRFDPPNSWYLDPANGKETDASRTCTTKPGP